MPCSTMSPGHQGQVFQQCPLCGLYVPSCCGWAMFAFSPVDVYLLCLLWRHWTVFSPSVVGEPVWDCDWLRGGQGQQLGLLSAISLSVGTSKERAFSLQSPQRLLLRARTGSQSRYLQSASRWSCRHAIWQSILSVQSAERLGSWNCGQASL